MEESFWEHFCYYFALDYHYLADLCRTYLTLRGLIGRFPKGFAVPHTPRVRVAVPLLTVDGDIKTVVNCHDYDSIDGVSDDDEVDVHYEGSLGSSVSSSCQTPHEYKIGRLPGLSVTSALNCHTPDIVRTVPVKDRSRVLRQQLSDGGQLLLSTASSYQSLLDNDLDRGFCSDTSTTPSVASPHHTGPAARDQTPVASRPHDTNRQVTQWRCGTDRLAELQQQLRRVQHDMAQLVEWRQSLSCTSTTAVPVSSSDCLQFSFRPTAASSPTRPQTAVPITSALDPTLPAVPPPPCGPPSPPPISAGTKISLTTKVKKTRTPMRHVPDMSEVLKQMSSVVLRPVLPRTTGSGNNVDDPERSLTFGPRVPLRSVSRNESIIACALRERFKNVRMLPVDDEEDENEDGNETECHGNRHSSTVDEWTDDSISQSQPLSTVDWTGAHSLAGRSLLRKVDRSKLPAVVTRDLPDDSAGSQP